MTRKLLSVEDFRAAARSGEEPDAMVLRASTGPVEMVPDSRRVKFVFSDGSVDRSGDTIDPAGWKLDNYKKNPVALFGHDSWNISSVMGRGVNVGQSGNKLIGEIEFADADVNPNADMAYKMVEAGLLSAVSVGFMPLKFAWSTDKDRPFGMDFTEQELLEISIVPVPCNQNAIAMAKSLGIDTGPIAEWAEQILDGEGRVPVPRAFLESVFRAAKTPRQVQQKYLSPETRASHPSDWKVGAARGLPVDDSEGWDGPAAAARMFAAAGFDGDTPDVASVRRGFLIYDSMAQKLKGSYKLPFADISAGQLKAVRGGIRAAASRLPQTDAPQNVLDEARSVLDTYEKTDASADSPDSGKGIVMRAGRTISAATAASLKAIMAQHAAAADCMKSASDMCSSMMGDNNSNVDPEDSDPMGDGPDSTDPTDVHDPIKEPPNAKELERQRRIRQADALRIAAEIAAA